MYSNKHDQNSMLFSNYAAVLHHTEEAESKNGDNDSVSLESEKYYLKSIHLDDKNYVAHCNYALLLETRLHDYNKAECYSI